MTSNWKKPDGYFVDISKDKEVVFLNRCVYCNGLNPKSNVTIQGNPVGYFGNWKWLFRENPKLTIPVHEECRKKVKQPGLTRNWLLIFVGIVVLSIGIYHGWNRWEIIAAYIILSIGPIIWQMKHSPCFEFEYEDEMYEFRFSNMNYAEEFAKLNNGKIRK